MMSTSFYGLFATHGSSIEPSSWVLEAQNVMDSFGGQNATANAVAYGAGVFVAAGAGLRLVYSSDNGTTWNPCTHDSIRTFLDVHFDNGIFIAVGNNGVCYTSPDGITFTSRTSQFNASTPNTAVMYGAGTWIVSATGNGYMFTSVDNGVTWTQNNTIQPFGNFTPPNKITYGNGLFVAVGSSRIATSPDGLTWTVRLVAATEVSDVAYDSVNNNFIAALWDNLRYISNGGISWTSLGSVGGRGTLNIECINYYGDVWVSGWEDNFVDESNNNGTTWPATFAISTPAPIGLPMLDLANNGNLRLGVGSYGRVFVGT